MPTKAFVTSIGETTTELCVWSLERQGFDVVLLQDGTSLWNKLKKIYLMADDTFLRVDADVVCNRFVKEMELPKGCWWLQGMCFGWYGQKDMLGGVQLYGKQTLPYLRKHINEAEHLERPETYMSRLEEFHNPRRFDSGHEIVGIHGYRQADSERVKHIKTRRGQIDNYDFELAERLDRL